MGTARESKRICKWYNVCPMKVFYEQGKLDKFWVENFCWVSNHKCVRNKLEKQGIYHPDNMLPDGSIDKNLGRVYEF